MGNPYFKFKQFTVWHDKCAMKVGTDGVLLGAWADVKHTQHILDIGTGTGLVALMLAQRSQATIAAIEIDHDAASQAEQNINLSAWQERITVFEQDFKMFETETRFDLIVSNPPYFVDALTSPEAKRTQARHAASLSYKDLFHGAKARLMPNGKFCVILPADVTSQVITIATEAGLYLHKQLDVITSPGKSPKRSLMEFRLYVALQVEQNCLLLEEERHQLSQAYYELTRDFYLDRPNRSHITICPTPQSV